MPQRLHCSVSAGEHGEETRWKSRTIIINSYFSFVVKCSMFWCTLCFLVFACSLLQKCAFIDVYDLFSTFSRGGAAWLMVISSKGLVCRKWWNAMFFTPPDAAFFPSNFCTILGEHAQGMHICRWSTLHARAPSGSRLACMPPDFFLFWNNLSSNADIVGAKQDHAIPTTSSQTRHQQPSNKPHTVLPPLQYECMRT